MTGQGSSCGACKFLRRKCTSECIFSPYFCYSHAADDFAAVHKVFGASNVSKLLQKLPLQNRSDAAISISYEALARMRNPIHGCVAQIYALQQQVSDLQEEICLLENQMAIIALGLPTYGSSHAINNPNNGLQLSFQCNDTSIGAYPNQQTSPLSSAEIISAHQVTYNQTQEPLLSSCLQEDHVSLSNSDLMQGLFERTDQEMALHYPWMYNGYDILYC